MMRAPRTRVPAVLRKELRQIRRDPRLLAAAILLPVFMLFIYGYAISSDVRDIRLGLADLSKSYESRRLVAALTASGHFQLVLSSDDPGRLEEALDDRTISVALVVPARYARDLAGRKGARVQVLIDGADPAVAQVTAGYVEAAMLSGAAAELLTYARRNGLVSKPRGLPPLKLSARMLYNEDANSTYFIVPGLIAVVLMALSALLTSGTIARERERGTIEQLIASPILAWELMLGKAAAYVLVCLFDVVMAVAVGTLWFGVPLRGSVAALASASGLFVMCALGTGLLISASIRTQQTAMSAAIMLTMVPSILLSGFYFPIRSMPAVVQWFTYLVPARYYMVIARSIFLKGVGFAETWPEMLVLAGMGAAYMVASMLAFRKHL